MLLLVKKKKLWMDWKQWEEKKSYIQEWIYFDWAVESRRTIRARAHTHNFLCFNNVCSV